MAWPSLISRTKDWGSEILTDSDLESQLDLIITYINDMMDSTSGHKHDATTAEGPKILINNLTIASRAQGDIYYDNGTNPTRLAKGTALQKLRMNAGATAPEWAADIATAATQTEMEAASSNTVVATPGNIVWHPRVAKCLGYINGSTGVPSFTARDNFDASITDNDVGDWTLAVTTDFSSAVWYPFCLASEDSFQSTDESVTFSLKAIAAGTLQLVFGQQDGGNNRDPNIVIVGGFGDQ